MSSVSVIIPNYNHAPYLRRRIDSVLNQTYTDFEVIIMDDYSTDGSRDIIEQYRKHPKVSEVIFNDTNSGTPFVQWEKGIALAKGDIIWIAESDDYASTFLLEKLVPLLSDSVGLVYCDSNVIDAQDDLHLDFYKKFRNKRFNTKKWNCDYQITGIQELKENLFLECTINNMSATIFRKEIVKYVNWPILKSFKYCGDWYFLVTLACSTSISYKTDALNFFKYGTNNFKLGAKLALNYHRERALVRYYYWDLINKNFDKSQSSIVFKQMEQELKVMINETVKGNNSFTSLLAALRQLKRVNKALLYRQLMFVFKSYLWKH